MPAMQDNLVVQENPEQVQKTKKREKRQANKQGRSQEPKARKLLMNRRQDEEGHTPAEKPRTIEKDNLPEDVQMEEPTAAEPNPSQQPSNIEEAPITPSVSGCQYGFGYLAQREKEAIPDACIPCPRSVDCMLSEYHKSENAVKEIKKWYRP